MDRIFLNVQDTNFFMNKSTFKVAKMDCPSEEQMIRMRLESIASIKNIEFDIPGRLVVVYHEGIVNELIEALDSLSLNSKLLKNEKVGKAPVRNRAPERAMLKTVLVINFGLFLLEVVVGVVANSIGLIADSLDMLADAIVYGLSIYAIGKVAEAKKKVAKIISVFQFALAVFGLVEVVRRFIGVEGSPVFHLMIMMSVIALIGNLWSLILLQKYKDKEVHMKASWIFTSNDVLANVGVIVAGVLVYFTASSYPDLIIGTLIFLMVARGSYTIWQLSKS